METFKKYLPLILTLVGALSPMISPVVQGFYARHPEAVAGVAGAWATFKWLLPSPLQGK
jgi:hypothetical protein